MSQKISAGLLPYRKTSNGSLEVFLAHYGGPLWARKDLGAWTVVKGEVEPLPSVTASDPALTVSAGEARQSQTPFTDEVLFQNAKREFQEETGIDVLSISEFIPLGEIIQRGGKTVHAWAFLFCHPEPVEGLQKNTIEIHSNTFEMEWPPRSGKIQQFPEIDRAEWFSLETARQKINPAQVAFLDRLSAHLSS